MRSLPQIILSCLLPLASGAAELYDAMPDVVRADERYVFYSHGLIVEGDDPRPVHPQFGVYDLPAVKQALFEGGGFNLIAHHRRQDTDVAAYVAMLEAWVGRLLDAGVPPSRITLTGFSRGAHLTAYAAARLKDTGINIALMGACLDGDIAGPGAAPLVLGGHFLSVYETTDVVRSCETLAARSDLLSFEEVAISTGKSHGAFYRPLPEWVVPLKSWIARTNR